MTKIRFWGQETGQINVKAKKKNKKEKPYCHHVPFLSILCGKSFFMYVIEYRPQQIDYWNKTLKMLTTCCLGSPLLVGPVWRCQPMQRKKEGRPADTLPGASSSQGPKDNPVKTAEMACGDFYNSGDRATMDEEGYIWFLGRNDDIINASGYRIGPAEVENALAEHPAVAESAVVSSLDPIRREVVKAFIVLTPEFLSHGRDQLTKELQQHVKSVTAP
ncbi:acyl-coenzyme A synthetase ACSM1, mitochondrial-like isoform X2 [Halichoerus grypus]